MALKTVAMQGCFIFLYLHHWSTIKFMFVELSGSKSGKNTCPRYRLHWASLPNYLKFSVWNHPRRTGSGIQQWLSFPRKTMSCQSDTPSQDPFTMKKRNLHWRPIRLQVCYPGVDPGGGGNIHFCQNFQKLHEIEKILGRVGGRGARSATVISVTFWCALILQFTKGCTQMNTHLCMSAGVCSIRWILDVLYRLGVSTSIVMLWEHQSGRAWIGTKFSKWSTPLGYVGIEQVFTIARGG